LVVSPKAVAQARAHGRGTLNERAVQVLRSREDAEAYVASVCFKHGPPRLVGVEQVPITFDVQAGKGRLKIGQTIALVEKIFGGQIADPEVLPPDGFLLTAVPVQHEREEPPGLLLNSPLTRIVG